MAAPAGLGAARCGSSLAVQRLLQRATLGSLEPGRLGCPDISPKSLALRLRPVSSRPSLRGAAHSPEMVDEYFFYPRSASHRGLSSVSASAVALEGVERSRMSEAAEQSVCPGCGIEMQDDNPKAPGFYQRPVALDRAEVPEVTEEELQAAMVEEEDEGDEDERRQDRRGEADLDMSGWTLFQGGKAIVGEASEDGLGEGEEGDAEFMRQSGFDLNLVEALGGGGSNDGGGQAGLDIPREQVKQRRRSREAQGPVGQEADPGPAERLVVCARCHALRNYGQVKDASLENLLPDFDFDSTVGARLRRAYGRRSVVLMVIDTADFDGSFPRKAAEVLAKAEAAQGARWQDGEASNTPRLLIVANKVDLLPGQVSNTRLEQWVRRRSRAGGAPRVSGVHLVSAQTGWGVRQLAEKLKDLAGPRGDIWVIGAQNAGKSSLINALSKSESKSRKGQLTEAPVPGTTVGVVALSSVLGARRRVLDTPGLLHPHQIVTRLTREEQKLVLPRKVLKPRTFRVKVGSSVQIGGLARIDVMDAPRDSIYLTVWVSAHTLCHMGRQEKADEVFDKHAGTRLQPPSSRERVEELGRWLPRNIRVAGTRWDQSSTDVGLAGLGWVAVAVNGEAGLRVWTYEGVAVTTRDAQVLDLAAVFETPGFTPGKLPPVQTVEESGRVEEERKSERRSKPYAPKGPRQAGVRKERAQRSRSSQTREVVEHKEHVSDS